MGAPNITLVPNRKSEALLLTAQRSRALMTRRVPDFISQLQRRTAEAAIGPSALRNQGAPGVIAAARTVLTGIDLRVLGRTRKATFSAFLDRATTAVLSKFPDGAAESWGGARKSVNLFLRDVVYNRDLAEFYRLRKIRAWLEVPLDKNVAQGLRDEPEGSGLPKWGRIKRLTPKRSRELQAVAALVAARKRLARVDLDVYYWRPKSEG